ncbi:hypothetical protein KFK09_008233 [Dendrobium nobile]|uniref:DUF3741 domain-containing protein n=1 Tax=Dendrobium nobile TaxID=94219 RepID=A0A8T3BM66_DENNO|nr:hypothetical protein KFK09_008233 [Dendrobium nobile]
MDCRDSSELQLLEVARGVRKLTQMIDSWSKAPNLDTRSKYIAKDLLRDSLALQESLITIRRLQETSRMMSFMEQKREFGFIKERQVDEDNNVEEFGSLRFGVGIYDDIINSISTNGSSRNHSDEMKGAIRGKYNNQNLVSFSNHGIASSNRFIEFPTNCSFSLTENSQGMTDLTMRAKDPNVIAKLMGLEKIPMQVVQSLKKEQNNGKMENIYKEPLDYENLRIQPCLTSDERRSHVTGSEAPTILIRKPLQLAHENKGENHKKKENLPAELYLKKEVSGDGHMLNRIKSIKKMDKVSMELFPKHRNQASVTHKQQRKEPMVIGVNKGRILSGKASEEKRDVQVTLPLFQTKRIKEPLAKADKNLATAKGGAQAVYVQSSTSRKNISIANAKTMAKHSGTYLMDGKKSGEKMSGISKNIKSANTKCNGVGKRSRPTNKASDFYKSFCTSPIHFPQQMLEDSKLGYGESTRMGSKSFYEVMPKGSKICKQRISVKAAMPPYDKTKALKEAAGPQKDVKLLLLTSPDFLTEAEELFGFDVQVYRTKSYQNSNFEEFESRNAYKLLIGCAMELITRKSYQLELLNHPMCGTYQQSSKLLISLEQLVEDVCNGMKELNGYYRTADLKDDLYLRLERDLRCKDMFLNASWDFGWIGWVCVEEFETVVEQIGEHIICGIVGEVAFDLLH